MKLVYILEIILLLVAGLTLIFNEKGYQFISFVLFIITITVALIAGIVVGIQKRDNKEF